MPSFSLAFNSSFLTIAVAAVGSTTVVAIEAQVFAVPVPPPLPSTLTPESAFEMPVFEPPTLDAESST
ncbi:hypothetical protein CH35J_009431 [Colletotrichum higginsianum]|uniref:Secreted protein n=1 Tax=Colletotrichum higginsianum TaxID=80884 RepID=A0A4T0VPX4_9PEZI|nr:hypothetical protein CH35J_009431 [Colletotrichum higginsianum]